jgi:hypothetical protein
VDTTLRKGYFLAVQFAVMEKGYDSLGEGLGVGSFLDAVQEGGLHIRVLGFGK